MPWLWILSGGALLGGFITEKLTPKKGDNFPVWTITGVALAGAVSIYLTARAYKMVKG